MKKKTRDRIKYCIRGLSAAAVTGVLIIIAVMLSHMTQSYVDARPMVQPSVLRPSYGGYWNAEDVNYDADTQAKLIALSAAYFSTDNNLLRQALDIKARDIRASAGKWPDDALIESAPILAAGTALDKVLSLNEETLLSAIKPHVTISASPKNDASSVTYTFGKTDIRMSMPSLTGNDGSSISDIVSRISVKEAAHYDAYIFYLSAWKDDCLDAVKALKAAGIAEDEIGTVSVDNNWTFTDAWNAIGPPAGAAAVPFIIIDTHATPMALDGSGLNIQVFSIAADFEEKKIDRLILLGCNAGHLNFRASNPAAAFLKKTGGGPVLASDGTVFNVGSDENGFSSYESRNDTDFQSCIGTNGRANRGWVIYRVVDGGIAITETNKLIVTVPWLLENQY